MIRRWLAAVAITLCLAAAAGPGRAAGDVSVDGNRFLRDGRPWVAEGVTLVALLTPEARREKKPTYAAARAAFGPGTFEAVRRFGADLVRYQVSQYALDPESKAYDPAYRDDVLAGIAATRAACPRRPPRAPGAISSRPSPGTAASCSRCSTSRRSATAGRRTGRPGR